MQRRQYKNFKKIFLFPVFVIVHNCLELTHAILTDRVIGHSAFKGADIVAALSAIRKTSAKPKIVAKECVCSPKLKGINTFTESEVIPADKKSNYFFTKALKYFYKKTLDIKKLFSFFSSRNNPKGLELHHSDLGQTKVETTQGRSN